MNLNKNRVKRRMIAYLSLEESVEVIDDHVLVFHCTASIFDRIDAILWRLFELRQLCGVWRGGR